MKRKDFIKKSLKYGTVTCLGMHLLSNKSILAAITASPEDAFTALFGWFKETLNQDLTIFFDANTAEYTILTEIKKDWGTKNTIELFNELSNKHGEKAIDTMRQFIKKTSIPYWSSRGEKEAHKGTELEDFTKALWNPDGENFKFTSEINNGKHQYRVSDCPFAKLAEDSKMHDWVYAMACITDYYMVPAFSKEIGFSRTKTLVQGDDYCNHSYYYKRNEITPDSLLGYCGLYCGGCPQQQKTKAYEPIDYSKEAYYETCEGCNSGICASWCGACEIKACARDKDISVCLDCKEYPCDKMTAFMNDDKYPYHKEVEEKMKQYKEQGLDAWLSTQQKEYLCKNCGTQFHFFSETCENCGNKV